MNFWKPTNINRKAAFAGQFYPGSKNELKQQLAELFESANIQVKSEQDLQAIIVPHAGYIFSGKVAASAYNQIPENAAYKRVFVIASSHRYYFNGASVYKNGNYETPLGEVKVDTVLCEKLIKSSDIFIDKPEAHNDEHSLEVQLPFLQYKLNNNFLLVPIILGTNDPKDCKKIAKALKPWFTSENLFVISTDFSHYPKYEDANRVDSKMAEAICSNKPKILLESIEKVRKLKIEKLVTSLCGWTSVLTLLYLSKNKEYIFDKIDYQNSGDAKQYGDKKRVVGYWSIAVYGNNRKFTLSDIEKKELLEKARFSISKYLETGKRKKSLNSEHKGILNEKAGAFVSIYVKNKLRGCIGAFAGEKDLIDVVQHMAVSAAKDRRFDSLKPKESEDMELEISVLSPLKKIDSINEIQLGKHGIYIKHGTISGTFLPQVATKTNWSLEEFLGHCSKDKAGIGWDGWKTAEIFIYEAFIFKG